MSTFKPPMINQTQLRIFFSKTGKPIQATRIHEMVNAGEIPQPKNFGKSKLWSIDILCNALEVDKETFYETININRSIN